MRNKLVLISIILSLCGCSKKSSVCNYSDLPIVAPTTEVQSIQNYLHSQNITATANPAGFYYIILSSGTGPAIVNLCSKITVSYVGKLFDGSVFDQSPPNSNRIFELGSLIVGWQKGIPLINKGGSIRLFIPPSLGYGPMTQGPIPGNSILIFDIQLLDIQ